MNQANADVNRAVRSPLLICHKLENVIFCGLLTARRVGFPAPLAAPKVPVPYDTPPLAAGSFIP